MSAGRYAIGLGPVVCALALSSSACDAPEPLGRVSVALSEDVCADYCLVALRASIFREGELGLPIGPALQVDCGEELSFDALPAGERVLVTMQLYDITGDMLFDGTSEALTIVADGVAEARVPLTALAPPELRSVTPDPVVVVDAPAVVTLDGMFGEPLGRSAVELGGVAYDASSWAWEASALGSRIALTVPRAAVGGALAVRRCGVASAPLDLRVIGAAPGESTVIAPACAGATAVAAAVDGASVFVAWSCNDGGGSVTEMKLGDAICPLDPGASWTLSTRPSALAVLDGYAWVGGAGGLDRITIASSDAATRVSGDAVRALAATGSEVFGLVESNNKTRLVRATNTGISDVGGVDAGLQLEALAASAGRLFVAARTVSGEGRLVTLPTGGVVGTTSLVSDRAACPAPHALAASPDGERVVLACAGGGVAVWRAATQDFAVIGGGDEVDALAFDDGADVALGTDGASLIIFDIDALTALHRFTRAAPARPTFMTSLPGHMLATRSNGAALVVLTPFSGAGPCGGAP